MAYEPIDFDGSQLTTKENLDHMETGIQLCSTRYIGTMYNYDTITKYTTLKFGTGSTGTWAGDATYSNMAYVSGGYNYGFIMPKSGTAICTLFTTGASGAYIGITSSGSRITASQHRCKTRASIVAIGTVQEGDIIKAVIQPSVAGTYQYRLSVFLY